MEEMMMMIDYIDKYIYIPIYIHILQYTILLVITRYGIPVRRYTLQVQIAGTQ